MDIFDPRDLKTKRSSSLDQIRYTNPLMSCRWKSVDVFGDEGYPDESKPKLGSNQSVGSLPLVCPPQPTGFVQSVDSTEPGDVKLIEPLTDSILTQGSLRNVFIQSAHHRWIGVKSNNSGEKAHSTPKLYEPADKGHKLDEVEDLDHLTELNTDEATLGKIELTADPDNACRSSSILKRFFQGVSRTLKGKEG